MSTIHSFLRQKRIAAGLSQGDMAKELKYTSAQFISNWERGLSLPPKASMKKLSKILNLDPKDFLEEYVKLMVGRYEAEIRKSIF